MNKAYYWFAALIVIIVIVLLITRRTEAPGVGSADSSVTPTETVVVSGAPQATVARTVTPVTGRLPYTQAVVAYKGRMMQFDAACATAPSILTIKNGATLLFDNRTPKVITFGLDTTKYTIPAYDYRLVAVTAKTFPHATSVDCNARPNVGTINVQK